MPERGAIPPNLHLEDPNPNIPFDDLRLRVPTALEPFPGQAGAPVLAGVNSFGFGGTNAHVVLQAPPRRPRPVAARPKGRPPSADPLRPQPGGPARAAGPAGAPRRLPSEPSRDRSTGRDISYTAALKRTHHDHRLALVAHSPEELAAHLSAFEAGETRPA